MKKILTFYIKEKIYGVDIHLVKEITRNKEYTSILGSKEHVKGLMNLRGNIITILDLSFILDVEAIEENNISKCVILKSDYEGGDQIGFLVDKTGDVIDLDKMEIYELPETLWEEENQYICNVVRYKDKMLSIVDLKKIIEG